MKKNKGEKILFSMIVGIFVLSIIIIPLGVAFQKKSPTPAQSNPQESANSFNPERNGVEGVVVKQDDGYYLETGGIRLFQLKGKEGLDLERYLEKNVKVFGSVETGGDGKSIIINVNKVEL